MRLAQLTPRLLALLVAVLAAGALLPAAGDARAAKAHKPRHPRHKVARKKPRPPRQALRTPFSIRPLVLAPAASPGVATAPQASPAPAANASTPTPTPTPAPTPATPACADLPRDGGGTWRCSFDEEFDGTQLDGSRWIAQQTATSGFTSGRTACFVDAPGNIAVGGGVLSLTARREAQPFTCDDPAGSFTTSYTSGMVSTWQRFAQAYGRFEVRARFPATALPGLQESLWLWPADASAYGAWPFSGEIDIAEAYSQYPGRAVPYVHYVPAAADPNVTNTDCLIADSSAFHTYALEWTTTTLKVIYDGATCLVDSWSAALPLTGSQPFDRPFIIALTQALGIGTNAFDPASTPLPATTQVDYVRAWT